MTQPILRSSLPDQAVAILKHGISTARWAGELPSEAELCREMHVSRDTVRKALAQLAHQQWIILGGRGRRHSIMQKLTSSRGADRRIIRVLTPYSLAGMGTIIHATLESLVERVTTAGYRVEFEFHPRLFQHHRPEDLGRLDSLPGTAAWLLFYATEPMQRWFAASGHPCVVVGRRYEGVHLSCVYTETNASARHAAGRLYAHGHLEMVYLIANLTSLSDRLASVAFAEEARRLGANAQIVEHAPDVHSVQRTLTSLLSSRPRPSGFISGCPEHCLAALYHFLGAGLRVPQDVALLSGWDDLSLEFTLPTMARYRVDGVKMGRKLASLLLDQIKHGGGKLRTLTILPEFVPGGTLESKVSSPSD